MDASLRTRAPLRRLICGAALALAGSGLLASAAAAASVTVCPMGCDAVTIQAGVDAANPGDVVVVEAGNYDLAEPVLVTKPLTIAGPNSGVSPNQPGNPLAANPARSSEATLAVTGGTVAIRAAAPDVRIDGLRFVNAAAAAANVQSPLIGAGGNFGGAAPGVSVTNNVFDAISRTAVYFNGPTAMDGGTVEDNRVVDPTRPGTGCEGVTAPSSCGHQLFNLWMTDHLSFQRNVVVADPGNGDRVRVLNVTFGGGSAQNDAPATNVTIAGNTIRNSCTYTCFALGVGATNVEIRGNDIGIDVGNAFQLHPTWAAGRVDISSNVVSSPNDFAVAIDGPAADLSEVTINRNTLIGGGIRNASSQAAAATCNWWGAATGPVGGQNTGPVTVDPWLGSADVGGPCPVPPPPPPPFIPPVPPAPEEVVTPPTPPTPPATPPVAPNAPSGNPGPTVEQQRHAREEARTVLGDRPVELDTSFGLGGTLVFVPEPRRPTATVPVVGEDTITLSRRAARRGRPQSLMALASPLGETEATVEQTVRIGGRTIKLPTQELAIQEGSTEAVELPLTRAMRRALRRGRTVTLTLAITVVDAAGNRSTERRTFELEAPKAKKKKKKSKKSRS